MNDLLIVILQAEQVHGTVLPAACLDMILISPERLIIIMLTKRVRLCLIDEQISVHKHLFSWGCGK
jgi:hypothetical protein